MDILVYVDETDQLTGHQRIDSLRRGSRRKKKTGDGERATADVCHHMNVQ